MDSLKNNWFPVCHRNELELDNPLGVRVLDEDIVLWRTDKELIAWQDRCPHRAARLSDGTIENGRLQCPYHGWEYARNGKCEYIPSQPDKPIPDRAQTNSKLVAEMGYLVWINIGTEPGDLPDLPEFVGPDYHVFASSAYEIKSSLPRVVENFLDASHFPFVHRDFLGVADRAIINDFILEIGKDSVYAEDVRIFQPDPDGSRQGKEVSYDYEIMHPNVVYLLKHVNDRSTNEKLFIMLAVRPVAINLSYAYFVIGTNYAHNQLPDEEVLEFHTKILMQDLPILEAQAQIMPLNPHSEIHINTDKLTAAYRHYLREQKITFATCL